jgi:hypothetical protein
MRLRCPGDNNLLLHKGCDEDCVGKFLECKKLGRWYCRLLEKITMASWQQRSLKEIGGLNYGWPG